MIDKNVIALFDLDGTLTAPRKKIDQNVVDVLAELKKTVKIALVSGSDLSKILEQFGPNALDFFDYVFSENGTVSYKNNIEISRMEISNFLGEEELKKLNNYILNYFSKLDVPIKRGTFIEYRNGMINISPIGRNCTNKQRDEFELFDKANGVRQKLVEDLEKKFSYLNLNFSIGGQISIDIFPDGWDKRFCLRFLEDYDEIHFFGDKADPGGNDYELLADPRTIGHVVKDPGDLINLISELSLKKVKA